MFSFDALGQSRISARKFDLHLYADYAELLCLAHLDGKLTRATYLSFLEKTDYFESAEGQAVDSDLPTEWHNEDFSTPTDGEEFRETDELFAILEQHDGDALGGVGNIQRDHLREGFISDVFEQLHSRWLWVRGDSYPFEVDEIAEEIRLKENLSDFQKLYVFLLLCSNLKWFKSAIPLLTKTFEAISASVFQRIVPPNCEVHVLGKGGPSSPAFTGNKMAKLKKLALCLNTSLYDSVSVPATDSGDAGLDLLAWLPAGDSCNGLLSFFGQCGCGKEWEDKQNEVSYDTWRGFFHLSNQHVPIVFVPYYPRTQHGDWLEPQKMKSFLIDRLRFFHYLKVSDVSDHQIALANIDTLLRSKISFG